MSVVSRLLDRLAGRAADPGRDAVGDEKRLAAAALLVHVARADGILHGAERSRLIALVGHRFGLDKGAAARFVERADAADRELNDVAALLVLLGRDLDRTERRELLGLAYQVAAADGVLHPFEDDLVWRVGRLLGFDDGEISDVRERTAPEALGG